MNNDLIGREALLDFLHHARKELFKEDQKGKMSLDEFLQADHDLVNFIHIIRNAPTVDIKDEIAGAYNEGYACGSRENKRPQGEWITIDAFVVKCSVCGVESFATPFCPRCGADMKGNE